MSDVVAVAVSGGRDSMALLHCTARVAQTLGLSVVALHVHHGLLADADRWADHVEQACKRWARRGLPVRCMQHRLTGRPTRGESVEAWARAERYRALADLAREAGASLVLLAHHRGDQAETFLLQALRGAGPAGLAAMPRVAERSGIVWARPWLTEPRAAVQAYVRRHRLGYVEDPSNADSRYARSRLRQAVMPTLTSAFPDAEALLAAAAQQAGHARRLQDEVGESDAAASCVGEALDLRAWMGLSPARRRNALRWWLQQRTGHRAGAAWLDRLMDELPQGASPSRWRSDGVCLRRYRGRVTADVEVDTGTADAQQAAPSLRTVPAEEGGVPHALLAGAQWRERRGSDRFQRVANTPPRSLKKQFQLAGVAPWARALPVLVDRDGHLLFVPGLGTDARALATPGAPRVRLEWAPGDA
jgi:tRNA(Ile)-lysidine synthase